MLDKIKYLLYRYNILKLDNVSKIIWYLTKSNIDPYEPIYSRMKIASIGIDAASYNSEIKYLLSEDMVNSNVVVKPIHPAMITRTNLSSWVCKNGVVTDDTDKILLEWLELAGRLIAVYRQISLNYDNVEAQTNSIKIKPYIINIDDITKLLLESVIETQ